MAMTAPGRDEDRNGLDFQYFRADPPGEPVPGASHLRARFRARLVGIQQRDRIGMTGLATQPSTTTAQPSTTTARPSATTTQPSATTTRPSATTARRSARQPRRRAR